MLELPACNADLFQLFLNEFSLQNPDELKLIVLDNGAFHKAQKLVIPENIVLIFLPPYSPELNPAEKIWAKFKRDFTNRLFHTLDSLEKYLCELSSSLQRSEVISITSFSYVFSCPLWTTVYFTLVLYPIFSKQQSMYHHNRNQGRPLWFSDEYPVRKQ